jgi:uncharacterized phiE125 gp8 family phage protein
MSYIGDTYSPNPSTLKSINVISSSSTLPVTVAEVKDYMRLGTDVEDDTILTMLNAAIRNIERFIDRTVVERTYVAYFNCIGDYTPLPFGPVVSVDSVSIEHKTSSEITEFHVVDGDLYINDYASLSEGWNYGTLKVEYTAGSLLDDESGLIDDDLKQVIIETTARIFERGEAAAGLPMEIQEKLLPIAQKRHFK